MALQAELNEVPGVGEQLKPAFDVIRQLRRWTPWLGAVLLVALLSQGSNYTLYTSTVVAVYAIAVLGQDWMIGRAGMVSIGGAAYLAVGAFIVAATNGNGLNEWPIQLGLAAVIGSIVGFLVGLPALRLHGLYLFLATLSLHFITLFVVQRYQGSRPEGFLITPPDGFLVDISEPKGLFFLTCGVLLVVAAFITVLQRHAPGRYWRSVAESDAAARSLGIDTARWKVLASVGSGAVTSIAGALYAYAVSVVTQGAFTIDLAITFLVIVYLGGKGTVIGPVIGAFLMWYTPVWLHDLSSNISSEGEFGLWFQRNEGFIVHLLFGVALLLVLVLEPGGLVAIPRRLARTMRGRGKADGAPPVLQAQTARSEIRVQTPVETMRLDNPLLNIQDLAVTYPNGGVGVSGLSLVVGAGELVALVGRNGAGKTTALRAIAGFPRPERVRVSGQIAFLGRQIAGVDPVRARRLGISIVQERSKVFPRLTVSEHVDLLNLDPDERDGLFDQFAVLRDLANRRAGVLSGGERQLVALAMAVAARPALLLVDEPSLGLSPAAAEVFVQALQNARQGTDMSVVLADQATDLMLDIASYVYVVEHGSIRREGRPGVLEEAEIREALIGA